MEMQLLYLCYYVSVMWEYFRRCRCRRTGRQKNIIYTYNGVRSYGRLFVFDEAGNGAARYLIKLTTMHARRKDIFIVFRRYDNCIMSFRIFNEDELLLFICRKDECLNFACIKIYVFNVFLFVSGNNCRYWKCSWRSEISVRNRRNVSSDR